MIDPVSVVLAAVVFAAGWLIGRHGRLKSRPKQPKPWCLCDHHYGAHDPTTGECQAGDWQYPGGSSMYKPKWETCACLRYTGPQPVEQYWVAPAADMSIVTAPRQVDR